jgi:hypothetical protein
MRAAEDGRTAAQEELAGLAVEHDEAERLAAGQPSWPGGSATAWRWRTA